MSGKMTWKLNDSNWARKKILCLESGSKNLLLQDLFESLIFAVIRLKIWGTIEEETIGQLHFFWNSSMIIVASFFPLSLTCEVQCTMDRLLEGRFHIEQGYWEDADTSLLLHLLTIQYQPLMHPEHVLQWFYQMWPESLNLIIHLHYVTSIIL